MSRENLVFVVLLWPLIGLQNHLHSIFNAQSSNCISEVSCSLSSCSLFSSSWPIYSSHEKFWPTSEKLSLFTDLVLFSTPYLPCWQQVVTSSTGPILVFPLIQPFGSDDSSSLGKVHSRQDTESVNCENSSVSFVMKYCPTSTVVRNPASVQNLLNLSCCDNFSIRSLYLCNRNSLWTGLSFKGTFVLITLGTNEELNCPLTTGLPVLIVIGFIFFKHFCDCSVKTELIYRNNCAKNSFNRRKIGAIVYKQFSTTFAF